MAVSDSYVPLDCSLASAFPVLQSHKKDDIAVVAFSLTVPAIVALISYCAGGYGISVVTNYTCFALGIEALFYTVLVPLDVIIFLAISHIVIIWNIADVVNKSS